MYLFQRIMQTVRSWFRPKRTFTLDVSTLESLTVLAERERTTPQAVVGHLLEDALRREEQTNTILTHWQMLSPREQEVVALICLHYTNRQIAARLFISPETVKTHASHAMLKLGVPNRNAMRQVFADLDFSQWE